MFFPNKYENNNIQYGFFSKNINNSTHKYVATNNIPEDETQKNRKILKKIIGVDNICFNHQIHSNITRKIDSDNLTDQKADSLVTKEKNIAICVQSADCVPILMFEEENKIIAAIHAGWRSAASGIIENTILEIEKIGGNPKNIVAILGPYIKAENYEVNQDFYDEINSKNPYCEKFFIKDKKMYFDLGKFTKYILTKLSIKNIIDININTYINPDCFSFRRFTHDNNNQYGSLISYIMLK